MSRQQVSAAGSVPDLLFDLRIAVKLTTVSVCKPIRPEFNLVPNECRFPGRHTAIPPSCEESEPIPQKLPNVAERIQTMSENQKARQYRGYDRAAVRPTANIVCLRRCDAICFRKRFGASLASDSTKAPFFELG